MATAWRELQLAGVNQPPWFTESRFESVLSFRCSFSCNQEETLMTPSGTRKWSGGVPDLKLPQWEIFGALHKTGGTRGQSAGGSVQERVEEAVCPGVKEDSRDIWSLISPALRELTVIWAESSIEIAFLLINGSILNTIPAPCWNSPSSNGLNYFMLSFT
jgi:hypothetical protein